VTASEQVTPDRVKVGHRPATFVGAIADTGRAVVIFDDRPNQPIIVPMRDVQRVGTPTYRHRESRA
jgi:hypothetical protein